MNFSWAMDLDPKGANNQIKEAIDKRYLPDDEEPITREEQISECYPYESGLCSSLAQPSPSGPSAVGRVPGLIRETFLPSEWELWRLFTQNTLIFLTENVGPEGLWDSFRCSRTEIVVTLNLYRSWGALRVSQESRTFPGLPVFHHKAADKLQLPFIYSEVCL